MNTTITQFLERSAAIKSGMARDAALVSTIESAALRLRKIVQGGGTIYTCGNGGSACDAMHFAEELVARYKRERPGIRAQHFIDGGVLTCWSNDYDYESAFARQVETFCTERDALVAISTSGESENVIRAVEAAKQRGTYTLALSGKGGGRLAPLCDVACVVPGDETDRIQEAHITVIHILCELLETPNNPCH